MSNFSWWVFAVFFGLHLISLGIVTGKMGLDRDGKYSLLDVSINIIYSTFIFLALYWA